ncbi:nicotinic acid mononucleotide adenylyltransferase, partial [Planktomarina sp.]|nr:nicotinic acid mononucleotide adenylyltransferase [Planktomarina sp.]
LKTRFTYHTLLLLKQLYPSTNFTWIMGADNMAQVHLWQDWKVIFSLMPVGVLARPGQGISARLSPAARKFASHQISESCSWKLGGAVAPAWCFVNLPMSQISSSEIRSLGLWS